MAKALIVYSSRTGETESIGRSIAEGFKSSGIDCDMIKASEIKNAGQLDGYDALVFGSATYHGEMIQGMKTFLFIAEKAGLEGKAGGSFGSFGWSGEAPGRIYDTMNNIFKMKMVGSPLRLKSSRIAGGARLAEDYGKSIAKLLKA